MLITLGTGAGGGVGKEDDRVPLKNGKENEVSHFAMGYPFSIRCSSVLLCVCVCVDNRGYRNDTYFGATCAPTSNTIIHNRK